MDWSARTDSLEGGRVRKTRLCAGKRVATFAEVAAAWGEDAGFRAFFGDLLAGEPFEAFLWETPGITRATADRQFEFVAADSPVLAAMPVDPDSFRSHWTRDEVVTFPNLGGDAVLVAPCPHGPLEAYPHLGAFVRRAPEAQQHAFWRAVALAFERRLDGRPMWLSTSGLGVAWLHVRFDDRPKYVTHAPYRVC